MRSTVAMMVLSFGCGKPDDECSPGFFARDGLCYQVDEPKTTTSSSSTTPPDPMGDLRAGWPACDVTSGEGTLDVAGCALGVCGGETYVDAVASLGEADDLDATVDLGYVYATWLEGVATWYPDVDVDGEIDEGGLATWVTVYPSSIASSEDGLGPGVAMSCFVDQLGEPDVIDLSFRFDDWEIISLEWYDIDVKVWDFINGREVDRSDGDADFIYLSY